MTDIEIFSFQCIFTTISSMIGFIANLFVSEEFYLYPNDWKREVEYFWSPEARCWVRYDWRTRYGGKLFGEEPDWAAAPDWGPASPWRKQPDWGPGSPCHRQSEFHPEHVREELSLVQILAIESFLFFGKSSKKKFAGFNDTILDYHRSATNFFKFNLLFQSWQLLALGV